MIGKIAFEQGSLASPGRISSARPVTIYRRYEKRPCVPPFTFKFPLLALSWRGPHQTEFWFVPQDDVERAMGSSRNKTTPIRVAEKGHTRAEERRRTSRQAAFALLGQPKTPLRGVNHEHMG